MAKIYPIRVTVNATGGHCAIAFAEEAASVLEQTDRLSYEITKDGLVLKGIWDQDLDQATTEIRKRLGKELKYSDYTIEYISGEQLLEPIMNVSITSPEAHIGDVVGSLNRRRGLVLSMENVEKAMLLKARIPLAELMDYRMDLVKVSQIDWLVSVEFHDYEPVPNSDGPDPNEPASQALRA